MNEFIRNLINKIDLKEGWLGNERDLAKLDAESLELEIEKLEDKVEELEFNSEDYFTIDKDKLEKVFNNAVRKMFFNNDGAYLITDKSDYDIWVDDAIFQLTLEMEKESEKA